MIKELPSIPHHTKQLENLSSSSPALLTTAISGLKVLSKARLKATHVRGLLHIPVIYASIYKALLDHWMKSTRRAFNSYTPNGRMRRLTTSSIFERADHFHMS